MRCHEPQARDFASALILVPVCGVFHRRHLSCVSYRSWHCALSARFSAQPVRKLICRISGPSAAAGNNFSLRDYALGRKVLNFKLTIFHYSGWMLSQRESLKWEIRATNVITMLCNSLLTLIMIIIVNTWDDYLISLKVFKKMQIRFFCQYSCERANNSPSMNHRLVPKTKHVLRKISLRIARRRELWQLRIPSALARLLQ